MYREFFGLKEPPFNLTPDPRFLYMSQRHREALASLIYGIQERKGFIALTGEIGSGKTTLCRAFLRELQPEGANVSLILNSYLTDLELLQTINQEFGCPANSQSKKELIDHLNLFLLDENAKGKTNILIIDESQNLAPKVLEQIRMLGNLETEDNKLLQIVLIGQPELADLLALPELEQLNQRITVRCHIGPLNKQEIYQYIRHRLNIAGAKVNVSLTQQALNRVQRFTGGVPRKINLLMDRALLAAYVAGRFQVDAAMVAIAEKELRNMGNPLRKRRRPGAQGAAWFWMVAGALLLALALLGFFWVGLQMGRPQQDRRLAEAPRPTSTPNPTPTPTPEPTPMPTPSPTPEPVITPGMEATLPGLETLPTLSTQTLATEWSWDENDIARVSDPELARVASLLTLARQWQYAFSLGEFRNLEKEKILNLNLPSIFRRPQIGLETFDSTSPIAHLRILDLPLALKVEDPTGQLAPWVVVLRLQGQLADVADPRLGRVQLGLPVLERLRSKATVIFRDPQNLLTLTPGAENLAVRKLQNLLIREKCWEAENPTGVFDEATQAGLARYQEKRGLKGTGSMDGPTAALVAAQTQDYRPKLNSREEN